MRSIRDRAAMYQAAAEETAKFGDWDAAPPPKEYVPAKEALHFDLGDPPADGETEVQLSAVARAAQRYQVLVELLRKDQDKPGMMQELEWSHEKMHSVKKNNSDVHSASRNPDAKGENGDGAVQDFANGEPQIVSGADKNLVEEKFGENYLSEDDSEDIVRMDDLHDDCDFDNEAVQVDEEEQLPAGTTNRCLLLLPFSPHIRRIHQTSPRRLHPFSYRCRLRTRSPRESVVQKERHLLSHRPISQTASALLYMCLNR